MDELDEIRLMFVGKGESHRRSRWSVYSVIISCLFLENGQNIFCWEAMVEGLMAGFLIM